jgi:hypothetical protein
VATKTQSESIKAAISYCALFGHRQKGAIWYYVLIRYINTYIFTVSRKVDRRNDDLGLYYEYSRSLDHFLRRTMLQCKSALLLLLWRLDTDST